MSVSIQIKWNGKKFPVEFQSVKELEVTPVKELKAHIQRMTGADPATMKLQAFGGDMNNDEMPLSVYGIRPGCFITLKIKEGHHHKHETKKQPSKPHNNKQPTSKPVTKEHKEKPAANEEQALIEKLQVIKNKLESELSPQVKKYEKDTKEFMNQSEKTEKEKKKKIYMGAYLAEQVMLVLFDLDAFSCGSHLNARQTRKELVQTSQALLDKVDEIKALVKNVIVTTDQ
ncbi:hypothetical protein EDC94DRAFT_397421 [Helicostylum pulchrum]|uniref:Uncharacterized protein n=1 Tax=Helicostylum pulchrum TaxID=562976 RepID=A0ABP9XVN2_9FUNG|nr:hypothetical protein EDC94DRAFT_397421 [Helicostylum pulchrum]